MIDGYAPFLPTCNGCRPPTHLPQTFARAWNRTMPRSQMEFYDSTKEYMRNRWAFENLEHRFLPEFRTVLFKCPATEQWMTIDAMDIDHEVRWADYLHSKGVDNLADAKRAYNDVNNLRLVSRTANSSHEFEVDDDGEFNAPGEYQEGELPEQPGEFDDFIVDDSQDSVGSSFGGQNSGGQSSGGQGHGRAQSRKRSRDAFEDSESDYDSLSDEESWFSPAEDADAAGDARVAKRARMASVADSSGEAPLADAAATASLEEPLAAVEEVVEAGAEFVAANPEVLAVL